MAGAPLLMLLTLAVSGCTARPPAHDRSGETHYNRRELPATPGVFSGKAGEWTVSPSPAAPGDGDETSKECPGREPSQCDSEQRH
ncbi:MAG: hypothetical protein L6Q83_00400 [Gammaproteobacteria bacterium]|nr:hypothetical protein [Gammaproteobacteria bacterium]